MVKVRPGSRKGMTKLGAASKKAARRQAAKQKNGLASNRAIVHPTMKGTWDKRRSPASNLSRIGLQASVNSVVKSQSKNGKEPNVARLQGDADCTEVLRKLEQEAAVPERPANRVIHQGEKRALQRMVAKYGTDWERMSRDLKLNYLQWTPRQLEKKILRMKELMGEE